MISSSPNNHQDDLHGDYYTPLAWLTVIHTTYIPLVTTCPFRIPGFSTHISSVPTLLPGAHRIVNSPLLNITCLTSWTLFSPSSLNSGILLHLALFRTTPSKSSPQMLFPLNSVSPSWLTQCPALSSS